MTYYTQPDGQGEMVFVPQGKCWNGLPVNRMTEEERNALGLFSYTPTPEVYSPTESELAVQELEELDRKLDRGAEDLLNALIAKGILDGTETELTYVMENKASKELARTKV